MKESGFRLTGRRGGHRLRYLLAWLAVILAVDGLVGENGLTVLLHARQQYRAANKSLVAARAENDRLREEIRRLRGDPTTIEDLARRDLGLVRPGETIFIIKDARVSSPR
jgi:cell division protein FtsB